MTGHMWIPLALALALALAGLPAWAEIKVAEPKSDADNFKGDTVSFDTKIYARLVKLGSKDGVGNEACVPAGSDLRGLGRVVVPTDDGKGAEERALFKVRGLPALPADAAKTGCDGTDLAEGTTIVVSTSVLSTAARRRGWSFGMLTVPYKYQFRGDRSLAGGAALGGYVGRRTDSGGLAQQTIVFAGVTKVDVPVTKDGKAGTEQMFGLSYGVGSLWKIKDSFQLGLVLGVDHVSKSADYANNGKPWISFSLGYDFFN